MISLKQLAERAGVTRPSIDVWIRRGILPQPKRLDGWQQYYNDEQLPELLAAIDNRPQWGKVRRKVAG